MTRPLSPVMKPAKQPLIKNALYGKIPFPQFTSYMHERRELPRETLEEHKQRWRQQPRLVIALDAVVSRLVKLLHVAKGIRKYILFKVVIKTFRFYFRAFNQLKVHGAENVPENGCIFIVNHPGSFDPVILMTALPKIIYGAFVAWGNGFFADMIETFYGISSLRRFDRQMAIEYMIRMLLTKNRYFGIWPEGHPHVGPIEQGYSTIVPVYAAINYDKDRIPFLPVLIRGNGAHRFGVAHKMGPIEVHVMKPVFINRAWLEKPENGGKTQREIIDNVMLIVARKNGQNELAKNQNLEWSRLYNANRERFEEAIKSFKLVLRKDGGSCEICKKMIEPKQALVVSARPEMEHLVIDPTGVHDLVRCTCGACYNVATRDGKIWITRLSSMKAVKYNIVHVMAEHGGSLKGLETSTALEIQS
ncbi:MAG TPA: lysophospholipid acyltransferase family protein [Candidatus Lokiarchaeia archaeon]|nr:lysophospholipid acyltransferase family protein [Candidatus Lokiarchaeia archaeon]